MKQVPQNGNRNYVSNYLNLVKSNQCLETQKNQSIFQKPALLFLENKQRVKSNFENKENEQQETIPLSKKNDQNLTSRNFLKGPQMQNRKGQNTNSIPEQMQSGVVPQAQKSLFVRSPENPFLKINLTKKIALNSPRDEPLRHSSRIIQNQSNKSISLDQDQVSQYIPGIISHYRETITKNKVRPELLVDGVQCKNSHKLKILETIFSVCAYFKLKPRTLFLTNNLFDRYVYSMPRNNGESLTLVAVGCLFMAAKYEEIYPPSLADLSKILSSRYSPERILEMESRVLTVVQFNLIFVSCLDVLELIAREWEVGCEEVRQMATLVLSLFCVGEIIDSFDLFRLAVFSLSLALKIERDAIFAKVEREISLSETFNFLGFLEKIFLEIEVNKIGCFDSIHGKRMQKLRMCVLEKGFVD